MLKNLLLMMKNNKARIFPFAVSLYLYALYSRCIYLLGKDIIKRINEDYYSYLLHKCRWLWANENVRNEAALVVLLSAVLLLSFYLLYRRSYYFYAVILAPIYIFLFVTVCSAILVRWF
ncbi:MAG: hypothetical protein IKN71_00765 [Alphaproteobacteria bacterium]|nr:hypothetical protein [Alphaproteobacteria bacterium]